jgi:hypothetical protein
LVSDGPDRAPLGHRFGTNSSQAILPGACSEEENRRRSEPAPEDKAFTNTFGIGTRECHQFRKKIFDANPQFALSLASHYVRIAKQRSYVEANLNILKLSQRLQVDDLNFSSLLSEEKDFCSRKTAMRREIVTEYPRAKAFVSQPENRSSLGK